MLVDADKIKLMRLEQGWTQDQMAELCGVSTRTIQRIEKTGVASLETTNALASVFKTERTQLLMTEGVRPASIEFSRTTVACVAAGFFVLGIALGAALI